MGLFRQQALHQAQWHLVILPGGNYQRAAPPLRGGSWGGNLSNLHLYHAFSRVPQRVPYRLHSGSNSTRNFGLHTFPRSFLQHLETAESASWLAPFRPRPPPHSLVRRHPRPSPKTCRSGSARTEPLSTATSNRPKPRRSQRPQWTMFKNLTRENSLADIPGLKFWTRYSRSTKSF